MEYENKKICGDCKRTLPNDSDFCQFCGSNKILEEKVPVKMIKVCGTCGKVLPDDSVFCQFCGSKEIINRSRQIKIIKKCKQCGKILPDDSVFCQYCGSQEIELIEDTNNDKSAENKEPSNKKTNTSEDIKTDTTLSNSTGNLNVSNDKNKRNMIFIAIAIFLLLFGSVYYLRQNNLSEIPIHNGVIIKNSSLYNSGLYEIRITAPSNKSVLVCINSLTNDAYSYFMVERGKEFSFMLPKGNYEAFYALGGKWYGIDKLFGKETEYYYQHSTINTNDLKEGYCWNILFDPIDPYIITITKDQFNQLLR